MKRFLPFWKVAPLAIVLLLAGCGKSPFPAPVGSIETSSPKATAVAELPEPKVEIPETHIVDGGETLSSIGFNYGLTYRELANWNGLHDPNLIQIGQALRLSPPANASASQPISVVKTPSPALVATDKSAASAASASAPVKPKTTILATPAEAPVIAGDVPLKKSPIAAKYVYQPSLLKKLLRKWESTSAKKVAAATPAVKPVAAAKPAAKPVAAGAPATVRKRFGVDWSWPAGRLAEQTFTETRKGVDFFGKVGEPVYAAAAGEVVYVGTGVKSYGRLVILKHPNNYLTAYAHNDKVLVKEGEQLVRGGKIAEFGNSGSERVMLHFEVRKSGKPIDPMQVLPAKL